MAGALGMEEQPVLETRRTIAKQHFLQAQSLAHHKYHLVSSFLSERRQWPAPTQALVSWLGLYRQACWGEQ